MADTPPFKFTCHLALPEVVTTWPALAPIFTDSATESEIPLSTVLGRLGTEFSHMASLGAERDELRLRLQKLETDVRGWRADKTSLSSACTKPPGPSYGGISVD